MWKGLPILYWTNYSAYLINGTVYLCCIVLRYFEGSEQQRRNSMLTLSRETYLPLQYLLCWPIGPYGLKSMLHWPLTLMWCRMELRHYCYQKDIFVLSARCFQLFQESLKCLKQRHVKTRQWWQDIVYVKVWLSLFKTHWNYDITDTKSMNIVSTQCYVISMIQFAYKVNLW